MRMCAPAAVPRVHACVDPAMCMCVHVCNVYRLTARPPLTRERATNKAHTESQPRAHPGRPPEEHSVGLRAGRENHGPTPSSSQEDEGRPSLSVPRLWGYTRRGEGATFLAHAIAPGPTGGGRGVGGGPHRPGSDLVRSGSNPKAHTPADWRGRSPRTPAPRKTRTQALLSYTIRCFSTPPLIDVQTTLCVCVYVWLCAPV